MKILLSLITSLLLTTVVSFVIPLVSITVILSLLGIISHSPLVDIIANQCYQEVWGFLMTFGEGSGTQGIITISMVAGLAGFLFEALNFYRFQILCPHPNSSQWLTEPKSVEIFPNSIKRS